MRYWTPLYSTLREHRKAYALAATLKVPRPHAIGLLVCLWTWALDNALDGDLGAFPEKAIADACGWTKKPSVLISALIACGWVDTDKRLHDWSEYAGDVADIEERKREQARKRQARRRSRNESPDDDQNEQNPDDDHNECHANVTRDTSVTSRTCHAPPCIYTDTGTDTRRKEGRNSATPYTRAWEGGPPGEGVSDGERPGISERRAANLVDWFKRHADGVQAASWDGVVRSGTYTVAQLVGALEYLDRRAAQGTLKKPYEYALSLLVDWSARGIRTREDIEENRMEAGDG